MTAGFDAIEVHRKIPDWRDDCWMVLAVKTSLPQ